MKKHFQQGMFALIIAAIIFSACKKNSVTQQGMDIYVCGQQYNGTNWIATYWKNGKAISLPGSRDTYAVSIAVSGNDVYVAGTQYPDAYPTTISDTAKYWKNGTAINLTDGLTSPTDEADAFAMAVSGNDVYVAGVAYIWAIYHAVYWKNGKMVILDNSINDSKAESIFVSGNDVYISGDIDGLPTYWKNGTAVRIFTNNESTTSAEGITVYENDLYVIIDSASVLAPNNQVAVYYKNGNPIVLSDGSTNTTAATIAFSGNDVYVSGTGQKGSNSVAQYWKNGSLVTLTDGSYNADAGTIVVSGSDVYVAGEEYNSNGVSVAKYWKNGNAITLSNISQYAQARDIFLSKP